MPSNRGLDLGGGANQTKYCPQTMPIAYANGVPAAKKVWERRIHKYEYADRKRYLKFSVFQTIGKGA